MHALKLKTIENLEDAWLKNERVELINGEIVQRPMARFEHGEAQNEIAGELKPYRRRSGPGGWWIATEIHVRYNEHQCPCHDIAGWRKERIPQRPSGVMELRPDWVCEIISPGHEKKDTCYNLILLQKYEVPYYWVIWPEDRVLIAYKLTDKKYAVIETIEKTGKARIEPFTEIEFDLDYIFGFEG
jgi:Uma2 family endonuclease